MALVEPNFHKAAHLQLLALEHYAKAEEARAKEQVLKPATSQ